MQVDDLRFASKNQLPSLSISETLVENGLNSSYFCFYLGFSTFRDQFHKYRNSNPILVFLEKLK